MKLESTDAERPPPQWARWAIPSVPDLIFIALLYFLLFTPFSGTLLHDAGTGWHIRTGQQFLTTHAIPRVDPFSSIMSGKPWFAWEWLYDAVVGQLEWTTGLNGVVALTALVIAAVFAWLLRWLILRGTNFWFALILTFLAFIASTIHALARPHVLSWLFVLAFLAVLDSHERNPSSPRARRRLWLLPPLMVLWVNVHASFVLGFAQIAAYWFAALWNWRTRNNEDAAKSTWELTVIGAACAAASLLNPYGWHLHAHVAGFLSNGALISHNQEYQSPDFHLFAPRCFLLLLLLSIATLIARAREVRLSQVLLVLLATYGALYAMRNLPTSSLLLAMVTGPLLTSSRGVAADLAAVDQRQRGHLWPIVATLLTTCLVVNGGWAGTHRLLDAHFDARQMPVAAVDYLEHQPINGPILSIDGWGGYLIYRLYPRALVVIDDRHDLFGQKLMADYFRMITLEPGWEEFIAQHPPAYVVLPRTEALASMLSASKAWRLVHGDDVALVFEASSPCSVGASPTSICHTIVTPGAG